MGLAIGLCKEEAAGGCRQLAGSISSPGRCNHGATAAAALPASRRHICRCRCCVLGQHRAVLLPQHFHHTNACRRARRGQGGGRAPVKHSPGGLLARATQSREHRKHQQKQRRWCPPARPLLPSCTPPTPRIQQPPSLTHAGCQVERSNKVKVGHRDFHQVRGRRVCLRRQPGGLQARRGCRQDEVGGGGLRGWAAGSRRAAASAPDVLPHVPQSRLACAGTALAPAGRKAAPPTVSSAASCHTSAPNMSQVEVPCGYRPSAAWWCLANLL